MAKYLLSSGKLTDSTDEYIIDKFITRLKLLNDQIPHSSNNGIRKTYDGIESDVLMDLLQYNVSSIASSVSDRLSVTDISYQSGAFKIKVKLNSSEYEISVSN